MGKYTFEGRVAVVTGAGRGIGRAYARLLAERGAMVVVNDLGGAADGSGSDAGPAQQVASEIIAAGGVAVADVNDISTPAGADALIDTAIGTFGRIDILINNAGMVRYGTFPDISLEDLEGHVAVHLYGSFNTTKAAWPHFVSQGYGRIVLTGSAGMFGMEQNLSYAIVKASMIGFANSTALAGAPHGIKINTIAPNAITRLAGADQSAPEPTEQVPGQVFLPTSLVSPMVAYLAHEDLEESGRIYVAGGGRFARLFVGSTPGYVQLDPRPTIEDLAAHWHQVNDETGYAVPSSLMDWSGPYLAHQFASSD